MPLRIAALLLWTLACAPVHAAEPLEYTVTLKKFELKNNTGQWITVIEPDRPVDLAQEEAKVSLFNTSGRVPDGNYINFRITLSESVRVQGRQGIYVTKEGGSVELGGSAVTPDDLPDKIDELKEVAPSLALEGSPGALKVRFLLNPEAGRDDAITLSRKNDLPEPFEVRKGSFIYAIAVADLDGAVHYAQKHHFGRSVPDRHAMFAWPIRRVHEIKLTVDNRSAVLAPDDVQITY